MPLPLEIPGYGDRFSFGDPNEKRDWREELGEDESDDDGPLSAEERQALVAQLGFDPVDDGSYVAPSPSIPVMAEHSQGKDKLPPHIKVTSHEAPKDVPFSMAGFDEAQHPRGQPGNAGQFTHLIHTTDKVLTEGVPTTPDPNGLVWFFPHDEAYGAYGKNTYHLHIPTHKILDANHPDNLAKIMKALPRGKSRTKTSDMQFAEKNGYLAVKRGSEVAMRPETARMFKATEGSTVQGQTANLSQSEDEIPPRERVEMPV